MDEPHVIRAWLALCKRAGKMRPDAFQTWAFMVGTQGTLEERTALGKAALRTFGIAWDYTVSHVDYTPEAQDG